LVGPPVIAASAAPDTKRHPPQRREPGPLAQGPHGRRQPNRQPSRRV